VGRPRVIFVNRVYRPSEAATAQLLRDLAEGLVARGWPVHVIASGEGEPELDGVRVHRTGGISAHGGWLSQAWNYLRFLGTARRHVARLAGPDSIVVPMTDPPMLGAVVTARALRRGARVVPWVQDLYPEIVTALAGDWTKPLLLPLRAWRDRALRRAQTVVCVGQDMMKFVTAARMTRERQAHLPNWAPKELESTPAVEAVAAQREAWGVAGRFVVGYSGNLGRAHEFDTLLATAARLAGDQDVVFQITGDGARLREVRAGAERAGLANLRFRPAQPRKDLAASLAAIDLHVVTLRSGCEAGVHPSKLAGVAAAGRPVAFVGAPDCGIARDLAREQWGRSFAIGDAVGLAEFIRQTAQDRALAAALGSRARGIYQERYRFDAALAHWERILMTAAEAKAPLPAPAGSPPSVVR
jgi:glycosyltransferase involved in cell wall biosynthesis